jgi:hypothetical protein
MRRAAAAVLLLLAAAPAARAGEGMYLTLEGGYSAFTMKSALRQNLTPQVGAQNASMLTDNQMPSGSLFGMHLGYNIAGHVGVEANFAMRIWSPLDTNRGLIGLGGLGARWFPLQGLVRSNRWYDISFLAGIDYVMMGGGGLISLTSSNQARGFDGMAVEFGGTVELYPARWVSLGITPRFYRFHPGRYFTDYLNRDNGGQIPLTGNVGGGMYSVAGTVTFHFSSGGD